MRIVDQTFCKEAMSTTVEVLLRIEEILKQAVKHQDRKRPRDETAKVPTTQGPDTVPHVHEDVGRQVRFAATENGRMIILEGTVDSVKRSWYIVKVTQQDGRHRKYPLRKGQIDFAPADAAMPANDVEEVVIVDSAK